MTLRILSPAKVNLFLYVLGRRPDGYHDLFSLMCRIGLYDEIILNPTSAGISLTCSDPALPVDDGNLALRAARLAVSPMPGWEVLEQAALAHLTFSKFLVWRDLEDNAAHLLQSAVVQHIARGVPTPFPNPVAPTPPELLDDAVGTGARPRCQGHGHTSRARSLPPGSAGSGRGFEPRRGV